MDELASFKNPPKQLLQRETALLNIADLVFTGGPSLYEAKRGRHANAHCFASSVDAITSSRRSTAATRHPLHLAIPVRAWASTASSTSASISDCWSARWPTPIRSGRSCWSVRW
jgi:hypothetical protein